MANLSFDLNVTEQHQSWNSWQESEYFYLYHKELELQNSGLKQYLSVPNMLIKKNLKTFLRDCHWMLQFNCSTGESIGILNLIPPFCIIH